MNGINNIIQYNITQQCNNSITASKLLTIANIGFLTSYRSILKVIIIYNLEL